MDSSAIIREIESKGGGAELFAAALLQTKEIRISGDEAISEITRVSFIGGVAGCIAIAGAASVSIPLGLIPAVIAFAPLANAWREHQSIVAPNAKRARDLELLLSDATPDEWNDLLGYCGNPQDLGSCLQAGMVAGRSGRAEKGDRYHAALLHAHNLGKVLPKGFVAPSKTGLTRRADPRDWRNQVAEEVDSEPTVAEVALVAKLCAERVGCTLAVVERAKALKDSNKAAATNLLITHAGISDRDYVKAGVPLDRLRAIKKWAAAGDALLPALPASPTLVMSEPEVVQPVKTVDLAPAPVALPVIEVEEDDDEIEDEEPIAAIPVEVVAPAPNPEPTPTSVAKPTFFQAAGVRQNSRLATVTELIEACMKEAYRSMALIGGERSGKTYLAAVFSSRLKAERATTVTYINLYDANGDSANDWEHADHVITANLNDDRCDVEAVLRVVYARLRAFQKETNTHLYFDEWVAFTSVSNAWEKKASEDLRRANAMSGQGEYLEPEGVGTSAVELMNLMSAIGSELSNIGKKQLKAMWLISPALRATDIYQQGKVMKSLAPAIVIIPPGKSIQWVHPTGVVQEIGFDLARYQVSEVNLAIPKSQNIPNNLDCDRAVFVGGTWYSLDGLNDEKPELETPVQQAIAFSEPEDVWEDGQVEESEDAEDLVIEPAELDEVDFITRISQRTDLTAHQKQAIILGCLK